VAKQGPPPPRSSRMPEPRRAAPGWSGSDPADEDEELPPWAGLGIQPRWADHPERSSRPSTPSRPPRGPDGEDGTGPPAGRPRGRLAAARARKTRRGLRLWGSVLTVAVVIVGGVWLLLRGNGKPASVPGQIVTSFLPGEFRTVPNTCAAVSAATLDQYLPGKRAKVVPDSLDGRSDSLCDWTLDARPLYRLLDVEAQAYAPNGLASGDGSATFAAIDAYRQAVAEKASPPKASHLPKAAVTTVRGLGTTAFSALQVATAGGDTTDLLTVVIRDRNVLITVVLEGLDHSSKGGYGPVSAAQLRAGALTVSRDILAKVK
jgi:hypothetical protein